MHMVTGGIGDHAASNRDAICASAAACVPRWPSAANRRQKRNTQSVSSDEMMELLGCVRASQLASVISH
jgi:hypothetical protein